ncbi:MAG TPA: prolyl-tRNA synthetase associated domain-containing protein [Longimicrobiales bacterium]|nr:prolyl-tRNA synthetase associated domain-containing protein [Longimicrobiales bacterium]
MTDMPPAFLDDGSAPATPEELWTRLDQLGIEHTTHRHAPVFTVEEAQKLKGDLPGAHTKNLFLRDKKGTMWLLVARFDKDVDLHVVAPQVGARGRLSFGSPERLMRYLGVIPGSVTPFAVLNDHGKQVSVALDAGLRNQEVWNAHPLDNAMTTAVGRDDLLRFLDALGHPPLWVEL